MPSEENSRTENYVGRADSPVLGLYDVPVIQSTIADAAIAHADTKIPEHYHNAVAKHLWDSHKNLQKLEAKTRERGVDEVDSLIKKFPPPPSGQTSQTSLDRALPLARDVVNYSRPLTPRSIPRNSAPPAASLPALPSPQQGSQARGRK